MKSLIFKATAVFTIICASFAFTAKGPLRVVACDVDVNICKLIPATFQQGITIIFTQGTFDQSANGKTGCATFCSDRVTVDPQG